jgi:hypothetical protein
MASRRNRYPSVRKSHVPDSPWRRGLAALGAFLERQGFVVEVVANVHDPTDAYIQVAPNIIVQVAWDRNTTDPEEPAIYGATIETETEIRHLGYTHSARDLITIVSEVQLES